MVAEHGRRVRRRGPRHRVHAAYGFQVQDEGQEAEVAEGPAVIEGHGLDGADGEKVLRIPAPAHGAQSGVVQHARRQVREVQHSPLQVIRQRLKACESLYSVRFVSVSASAISVCTCP